MIPVSEVCHPSCHIREELEFRGWDLDTLAMRMGPEDYGVYRLSLDFYCVVGPHEPDLLLGEKTSEALGRAFGVAPDFFLNLHQVWRQSVVAHD